MKLQDYIEQICPADRAAIATAQNRWNSIAKPLNSLGLLEAGVIKIAGIMGTADVDIGRRATVVMCADNGIVEEGVTQSGQDVTAIVTENMSSGDTSVCCMSRMAKSDVIPVNIGCAMAVAGDKIRQKCVRMGTANFTKEPAMTRDEAENAIIIGIELVRELKESGYKIIATGEMGIGNTTTSSAITAVLLEQSADIVTGRGAGLSGEGLLRKIATIKKGISLHNPDKNDAVDVIAKVGGLDIAGLCGVFLGGAIYHIPIIIDGFISATAALCATRISPYAIDYMIAGHASKEPAGEMLMSALGVRPFLYADMCLGEGTGAVAVMPILDMAIAVYSQMSTFEEIAVEAYQPLV